VPAALRAFESRNFRVYFAGHFTSLLGFWIQNLATSWLVYKLTGSPLLLGVTAGAQQLPILFAAPIAGVLAERTNRQRALIVLQLLAAAQSLVLAALAFTHVIAVSHIVGLSLMLGFVSAFDTPIRQSFQLELISDRRILPNAIALQTTSFQVARFLGPTLAGLILAAVGEAWCFLANAASFLVLVVAYMSLRVPSQSAMRPASGWKRQLVEGFSYCFGFLGIRRLLLLLGTLSFFTAAWSSLMPIFAAKTFAGNSRTLGFLIGSVGFGALWGGGFLALRSSVVGLGRVSAVAAMLCGLALAAFTLSKTLWLSFLLLGAFGFGQIVTAASVNTILQTIADEDKRSRVISIYIMVLMGIMPIGNFVSGAVAERIGVHHTLLICGLIVFSGGALFAATLAGWIEAVRPIYVKQGHLQDRPGEREEASAISSS
jgi:MFS family permease